MGNDIVQLWWPDPAMMPAGGDELLYSFRQNLEVLKNAVAAGTAIR